MAHRAACAVAAAALSLTACAATHPAQATSPPPRPSPAVSPAPAAPPVPPPPLVPRTKAWFALDVGDCVTAIPAVDIGQVDASVVDCATPHLAEVYLRKPTAVDAAVAEVANQTCKAGLPGGPFVATYLIDSNQDRTSDNPLPSTIICLLEAADGRELTAPERG